MARRNENCIPSIARIREAFDYNPKTGVLVWKIRTSNRTCVGKEVGGKDGQGYRILMLDKCQLRTHQVAFAHYHGKWPVNFIDHIDQNKNNNAIKNLRDVSNAVNLQNQSFPQINSSTKIRGVWFDKRRNRYVAETSKFKKKIYLGSFLTKEEAQVVYNNFRYRKEL